MALVSENVTLADKTTIRIGGLARWYTAPCAVSEVRAALAWAKERGLAVCVLGRGSNVVFSDQGWPGLVLHVGPSFSAIEWNGAVARCGAGALLHTLVIEAAERGLAGVEVLAGIPGTIGGAIRMNAGAFGAQIGDSIEQVTWVDTTRGEVNVFDNQHAAFSYRHSVFCDNGGVVLEARLVLKQGSREVLQNMVGETLLKRRDKQPLDLPNCGSVFKNPAGQGAGRHVEAAGLKGFRIGGAQVSEKHANFIVNTGGATAENFRAVVAHVQQTVFERTGIMLEPEVVFVGEFRQPLFQPQQTVFKDGR